VGAVGVFEAVGGEVFLEFSKAGDLKGEMGEVGLDVDGTAGGKGADLDEFFAVGGFEEDEFRAAWGFVAAGFFEAKDVFVEGDGALEVVHAVAGVEQLGNSHGREVSEGVAGWQLGGRKERVSAD